MTIDQLRGVNNAQPFQPYTVHLADGRNLEVPHKEFLAVGPRGRTAIVFRPNGSFNIVDVMLITGIEVATVPDNGHGNGNGSEHESSDRT